MFAICLSKCGYFNVLVFVSLSGLFVLYPLVIIFVGLAQCLAIGSTTGLGMTKEQKVCYTQQENNCFVSNQRKKQSIDFNYSPITLESILLHPPS